MSNEVFKNILAITEWFHLKKRDEIGSKRLGFKRALYQFAALLFFICVFLPAMPFIIMMAAMAAVVKWFFLKFRTL
jgi:hypothetical protein